MLKTILSVWVILACSCLNMALAQPSSYNPPPPIIPPSPDAAALGRYGSTPVGLHTGIPNISIPLHTIKTSRLEVPIAISYHAGGIKVSELASWIGLGWSLQAGGVITRSVVNQADNGGFWAYNTKSASEIDTVDYVYAQSLARGQADGESDYYFYNFNGRSGKFVYRQNDNQNPFLIPQEPIKITYDSSRFQIRDETGVVYKFGAIEYMESLTTSLSYHSCYYLSEIISADGTDHIYFTYAADTAYMSGEVTYTETVGQKCLLSDPAWPPYRIDGDHVRNTSFQSRLISSLRLTEISYSTGKVTFIRDFSRSDAPESRLAEIKVYKKNSDGTFAIRKTFTFGEDYFMSNTGVSKDKYRLKLTYLEEKNELANTVKKHNFFYEETVKLPHKSSLAQDWWGFYNGKTNNKSLIATESISFLNLPFHIGDADREPDATSMQAGILKTIVYPTGGYTEFDYEPHSYAGTTKTQHDISAAAGEMGNTTELLQETVTFTPTTAGWARVHTYCSDVTDGDPFFSTVIVRKQNGADLLEHIYQPYTYNPFAPHLEKDFWVYLLAGTTYELTVKSKGNSSSPQFNGAAFSQATIYWEQSTPGTPKTAGGLRVREIRDYEGPGASPMKRVFKYGSNESGIGTLLIPEYGLNSTKREIDIQFYYLDCSTGPPCNCHLGCTGKRLEISSQPPLELTALNGAPVVYGEVAVYEDSETGQNGKQVHKFDVQEDTFMGTLQAYNNGRFQMNEGWRGGDEIWEGIYKGGSTSKVKETANSYAVLNGTTIKGTKVGWKVSFEGSCFPEEYANMTFDLFYFFDYPIHSGVKKLLSSNETMYSSTDPSKFIYAQVDYEYLNLGPQHQQLSSRTTINSPGDTLQTRYWYPADYNNVENISTLKQKNIISTPIKTETYRNNKIISGQVNRLNDNGKPTELYAFESLTPVNSPVHSKNTIVPTGYNKKYDIDYDGTSKSISRVQKEGDISTSYLWGYNNSYPIAKIDNATPSSAAYSSFESLDKGNWNYGTTTHNDIPVKTGTRYYKMNAGNITKSLSPGKYKLEYWAKGTAITLTGGTITTIRTSGADANGWILYEKEINVTSTVTFQMSGASTAHIDELRIYPVNARMTTYTYDPVNGMTSITDPNNFIAYYEYDDFGRLKHIKDKDGNIVKSQEYHYKAN